MRLSNNYDVYSRSINLNNVNRCNNPSNPFFTGIFDKDDDKPIFTKKQKYTAGSIIGVLTGILGFLGIKKLGKNLSKATADNIKPVVNNAAETTADIVENLIKRLKPKDEELAREIFPILEKNANSLNLKQEDYNKILSGINNQNRTYMRDEGLNLIFSQMDKMHDLLPVPVEDILSLINIISKENQDIFVRITNDKDTFKLMDIEDIVTYYYRYITPENKEYVFDTLVPFLEQYAQKLKLRTATKYARLFSKITPETQDVIPTVADSKILETKRINKFEILMSVTKENKDCIKPLLDNIEALGLNRDNIIPLLKSLKNEQTNVINIVGKNIDSVNKVGFELNELFSVLTDDNKAKIFDTVIKNPQGYKIEELYDLETYLKNLDPKNLEVVDKVLLPKLLQHADVLELKYAEYLAEIMGKLTPKTIDSVDIVAKYAKEDLGHNVYYPYLLQAITEENQVNLPEFLANIKNTYLWQETFVSPDDFAEFLNTKGWLNEDLANKYERMLNEDIANKQF